MKAGGHNCVRCECANPKLRFVYGLTTIVCKAVEKVLEGSKSLGRVLQYKKREFLLITFSSHVETLVLFNMDAHHNTSETKNTKIRII